MANENPSQAGPGMTAATAGRAAFEIVAGHPSPEELAAVTVALRAKLAASAPAAAPSRSRSVWADRARLLRLPVAPGPGAWRRAALPR